MITLDNFFQREKVKSAKAFARLVSVLYGTEKATEFLSSYVYLRNLDNLNDDQGAEAEAVQSELELELEKLQDGRTGNQAVNHIIRTYGPTMADYFASNVEGFLIDNAIMQGGQPLPDEGLRDRNKHHYLPGFQITSLLLFGREFDFGPQFERMGDTYIQYDALVDISEDFPVGLLLFSKESLAKYTRDGILHLQSFYHHHKQRVLKDIRENSTGIFETNMPAWFKVAFSAYFGSRALKLSNHAFDYQPEIQLATP